MYFCIFFVLNFVSSALAMRFTVHLLLRASQNDLFYVKQDVNFNSVSESVNTDRPGSDFGP